MFKYSFIAIAVSILFLSSCTTTKKGDRLSYNTSNTFETRQALNNADAGAKQLVEHKMSRVVPDIAGIETGSALCNNSHKTVRWAACNIGIKHTLHKSTIYAAVQRQADQINNIIRKPAFERHASSIKENTPPDYGQISSFFLVLGALVIIAAALINPALLLTLAVVVICLLLFLAGIASFFFWLRKMKDTIPWGMSYGDFALIFLLAGVVGLAFALWLVYYFSFLLVAGAIVLGILWLIHLKDKINLPGDK